MEAIERLAVSHDWVTLLLLAVLLLLASAKYFYPQRFVDFSLLFVTNKYLLLKGRDPKILHPFNVMFFVVNVISVSLFVLVFYQTYSQTSPDRPKFLFTQIAGAYLLLVLGKVLLEKLTAKILALEKNLNYYLFYKLSYRNFMALVLLPLSMLFIYVWEPSLLVLYSITALVLLMNFMIIGAFFKKNQQYLMSNLFYFILYLCALEIGPYYILYKLITKN